MSGETPTADPARRFDFWLGEWTVENDEGEQVGTNVVSSVHDGHAIEEQWTSDAGTTGSSLNTYDPSEGEWVQFWTDQSGRIIELRGGFEDGAMRLVGTLTTPDGERQPFRGTWTPETDDRVVQQFEVAPGGGEWETWFRGIYSRTAD